MNNFGLNKLINKVLSIKTESGDSVEVKTGTNKPLEVEYLDQRLDAFQRLRVSNPQTLFDSKNLFPYDGSTTSEENLPLFYDNQEVSGSGTSNADIEGSITIKELS